MSIIQTVAVLIFVTSVLTSSVDETVNNHENEAKSSDPVIVSSLKNNNKNSTNLTDSGSLNRSNSDTVNQTENAKQPIAKDGSSLSKIELQSSPSVPVFSEGVSVLSGLSQIPNTQSQEITKESSIVPRKGVGDRKKISARKGVNNNQALSDNENLETPNVNNKISTEVPVLKVEPISPKIENINKTDHRPEVTANKTSSATVLVVPGTKNVVATKRKPKPTFTTGEGDDDGKGMPSSPTQTQLGVPGKVDYIVPVVITIMATPILGIAAYILYTRGRDCWDKRHYRRMDFLIDGMYND